MAAMPRGGPGKEQLVFAVWMWRAWYLSYHLSRLYVHYHKCSFARLVDLQSDPPDPLASGHTSRTFDTTISVRHVGSVPFGTV